MVSLVLLAVVLRNLARAVSVDLQAALRQAESESGIASSPFARQEECKHRAA